MAFSAQVTDKQVLSQYSEVPDIGVSYFLSSPGKHIGGGLSPD
jgi:hypothetical protein